MSIREYRLTSMEEPSDEILHQLMEQVAESARQSSANAKRVLQEKMQDFFYDFLIHFLYGISLSALFSKDIHQRSRLLCFTQHDHTGHAGFKISPFLKWTQLYPFRLFFYLFAIHQFPHLSPIEPTSDAEIDTCLYPQPSQLIANIAE